MSMGTSQGTQLLQRPGEGITMRRDVQIDTLVFAIRIVMIVWALIKAVKTQQLCAFVPHLAEHLNTYPLIRHEGAVL